jgi:hypothetical protein
MRIRPLIVALGNACAGILLVGRHHEIAAAIAVREQRPKAPAFPPMPTLALQNFITPDACEQPELRDLEVTRKALNQRQRRKLRRQRYVAGDRRAFA